MTKHEEAVAHARDHALNYDRMRTSETKRWAAELRYVADMANWALVLEKLLYHARPLADTESAEGLKWMLDVRAALAAKPEEPPA